LTDIDNVALLWGQNFLSLTCTGLDIK